MTPFQKAWQNPAPGIGIDEFQRVLESRPTDNLVKALTKARDQLLLLEGLEAEGHEPDWDGPFPPPRSSVQAATNLHAKMVKDMHVSISAIEKELGRRSLDSLTQPKSTSVTATIFLMTDGQHVTLGHNGQFHGLTSYQASSLKTQGAKGFVATVQGDYHGKEPLVLTMDRTIEGATIDQWDAAVAAYLAKRT